MEQKKQHKIPRHIEIDPSEKVILTLRQHWSVFRLAILLTFFLPFLLLSGIYFSNATGFLDILLVQQGIFWLAIFLLAAGLLMILYRYYFWKRTLYIVTDQRVMMVVQEGLFSRSVQQAPNHKIMNVSAKVEGLTASLYGYGDVSIEVLLPGREKAIVFHKVGHPHQVQHQIMQLSLSNRSREKAEPALEPETITVS